MSIDIVDTARDCIGVRWRHQGRSLHGLDCAGLIIYVAKQTGRIPQDSFPGPTDYGRRPDGRRIFSKAFGLSGCEEIGFVSKQAGDILIFNENRFACHVGILTEKETIIHAYAPRKKVLEEMFNHHWLSRLVTIYRLPKRC